MKIITSLLVASTIALNAQVLATVNSEDVSKNDEEKVTFLMGKKQYREAQEYENNTYLIFVTGIETNSPEYLCVKADNNWLKPNKQKESLDTSFLSKKEDNLVKPFTLEQNQLSDEKSIINCCCAFVVRRNTGTDCIIQKCNRQDSKASE